MDESASQCSLIKLYEVTARPFYRNEIQCRYFLEFSKKKTKQTYDERTVNFDFRSDVKVFKNPFFPLIKSIGVLSGLLSEPV